MRRFARTALAAAALLLLLPAAHAQFRQAEDEDFIALRDAARRSDADKTDRIASRLSNYAIDSYVNYYRIRVHLKTVPEAEIRGFLTRYDGTAIADRLRNDWLLELGRTRDWARFDEQYAQFALDDDTQLKCYALMSRIDKGQQVAADARTLLAVPKDYGVACVALLTRLAETGQFDQNDLWEQVRLAAEVNNLALARQVTALVDSPMVEKVAVAISQPALAAAYGPGNGRGAHEAYLIALGRLAKTSPEQAVRALSGNGAVLTPREQAQAWAQIALPASFSLAPEAAAYWRRADGARLSLEGYQWRARAALRAGDWKQVGAAIDAMPAKLRGDATWVYWSARALKAQGQSEAAQQLFASIADQTNFYGQLAIEESGRKITIPASAAKPAPSEVAAMAANPGLRRAMKFFQMNLRFEGVREWNWELRKMSDRQHLAAAEFARQNNVLDRMVNTSDRTRAEVDFEQRFPTPFRDIMHANTQRLGIDMAWVYGLIRQESRFIMDARSQVGASGLMQIMPATARWVANKIGFGDFAPARVNEIDTNILLGTNYLNIVLNDLDGSQALATAAYNAGPARPRAWRSTLPGTVEGAIFAETIPFSETRGYVKNVLSNATYYAALFDGQPQSLKERLGTVGPKQ
ncbi:lytic transglycosylase domain-containing protein [Herminiimonas sp. CN]|uniref:lytic transglycosylase domain-containing protein n=1 Tax=Herminiimonas sp. CN TaxID=1349818 RepID=UPI0005551B19|nr:lytic transglycosylase domain-containing protein [Herminiimonas sp. CN]